MSLTAETPTTTSQDHVEGTSLPDLLYSDVEEDLRSSVRALVTARSPWSDVLARTEAEERVDVDLWARLGRDLGVLGLPVAEDRGGAGASWREVAVVAEELGRAVAAVPFLGSAVMATAVLDRIGATDLLEGLAEGAVTAALLIPFGQLAGNTWRSTCTRDGDTVSGTVRSVADARVADVLLVPTQDGALVQVAVDQEQVTRTPVVSLDETRPLVDIVLDRAAAELVAADASSAVEHATVVGAAVLASEQLGVAEWCLQATVGYLQDRRQFGRTLASYQALRHRCADLWVQVTQARAVARYAAACAAEDSPDLPVAASLAQALCSDVAVHAAEECLQLHGGIGFTWENPVHLYLKRATSSALALGSPHAHRSKLGRLVNLPAPLPEELP
ncbi:acyl-CoA dehydrogenase family protein [Klenkia brasiliensis]|uniref:Acyl-CoA dehydrogenase n=1 Tax=Klenkia brasiliensis TaxID=333142 RepID=A0A1G7S6T6_9ACTN|nr:acyl-CoA dehydrogenase family protein [Klenkia brasiliensis]SDG18662.1 Acyl-CoA dehydrogenase [Klenkia brasiliensis]